MQDNRCSSLPPTAYHLPPTTWLARYLAPDWMQDNRCRITDAAAYHLPPTIRHLDTLHLTSTTWHLPSTIRHLDTWHLPPDIYHPTSTAWHLPSDWMQQLTTLHLTSTTWLDAVPCTSWLYLAIIVPDWMDNAGWIRMQKKVGEMLHFSFSGCLRKIFILFTFFNAQEKAWYFPVYFLLYFSRKCRRGGDWQGCRKRMPQGSKSRLFTN